MFRPKLMVEQATKANFTIGGQLEKMHGKKVPNMDVLPAFWIWYIYLHHHAYGVGKNERLLSQMVFFFMVIYHG